MSTLRKNNQYFPDFNNMSYDETCYYIYGIDIDLKKKK